MKNKILESMKLWVMIMVLATVGMIAFTAYETLFLKSFSVIESDYEEE